MAAKNRSPERQKTIDDVRDALFENPEILTEDLMQYTAGEYFKQLDVEKVIRSAWKGFTRRIVRAVRDDTNLPVAFNHPTEQGRVYVNVEVCQDIHTLEHVLEVLIDGRDSRNRAIAKVQKAIDEQRKFMDEIKEIKEGELVESTKKPDDEE